MIMDQPSSYFSALENLGEECKRLNSLVEDLNYYKIILFILIGIIFLYGVYKVCNLERSDQTN